MLSVIRTPPHWVGFRPGETGRGRGNREVRKQMELRRPRRSRRLPKLLPDASLKAFYETVDKAGNLQHQIMLRLLFYTAVRVSELTDMAVDDVDIEARKIFIEHGKGDKDRYILFPDSFALILQSHLAAHPDNRYLFESRHRKTVQRSQNPADSESLC